MKFQNYIKESENKHRSYNIPRIAEMLGSGSTCFEPKGVQEIFSYIEDTYGSRSDFVNDEPVQDYIDSFMTDDDIMELFKQVERYLKPSAGINESTDIFSLTDDIAKATDTNDHNGARIILAKALKDKGLIKSYQGIADIQHYLREMPVGLLQTRDLLDRERLFKQAKYKFNEDEFSTIMDAF